MQIPSEIIERASKFRGTGHHLEAALGAYAIGQLYGWRVVYLLHAQHTLRRYEKILGGRFDEMCPERTELSRKSVGLAIVDRIGAFWRVAKGSRYSEERHQIGDTLGRQGSLL